jgi:SAM-dependent methyltransferase
MGITLSKLQHLRRLGVIPDRGSVLDIGSSNLYGADVDGLRSFAAGFGRQLDAIFVEKIAAGSVYGPGITKNEAFVGALLEEVGINYLAFDVAIGHGTLFFDLNSQSLTDDLRGSFDAVINFGTTEHVINQLNSFQVIHDATKVGGYIVHQLPAVGFIDHGFFCYTPRFFFDLAGYNSYEVIDFSYDGPGGDVDMYGIVNDYVTYFPALKNAVRENGLRPPNYALNIILRKTSQAPFQIPMETSTSVVTENAVVTGRSTSAPASPTAELEELPFTQLTQYWCARLIRGASRRLGLGS